MAIASSKAMLFHPATAGLSTIRPEFFIPVPVLSFVVFVPGLIRTLLLKDRLYERLYTDHRDIWDSLGRPCGWQWRPPGTWFSVPNIKTSLASLRRTDPGWLVEAPELRELFYAYRAGLRRWNFVAMPTFIAASLLFALLFFLVSPSSALGDHWEDTSRIEDASASSWSACFTSVTAGAGISCALIATVAVVKRRFKVDALRLALATTLTMLLAVGTLEAEDTRFVRTAEYSSRPEGKSEVITKAIRDALTHGGIEYSLVGGIGMELNVHPQDVERATLLVNALAKAEHLDIRFVERPQEVRSLGMGFVIPLETSHRLEAPFSAPPFGR